MSGLNFGPQPGPQTQFLESGADITIYGGSAGGGKTFGMLLDPLRHIDSCPKGGAVYFRKTTTQIKNEGGLWDDAVDLYQNFGGASRTHPNLDITFKNKINPKKKGFKITFAHLQHEKDKYNYQGSQIPVIYFDELTHFSRSQFLYLVGRNRSTCGIKPYVRATCNPDKNSWVREFIDWWIGKDGYAIKERSGVVRYLIVYENKDHWFDTREEALEKFPGEENGITSVTFILSRLKDNKILNEKDPGYLAKLKALPKVERERLLGDEERGGNWDILPSSGMYFKQHYFEEVDEIPPLKRIVRCWDRAATEWKPGDPGDPDHTAGVLMGETYDGRYIILDIQRERYSVGKVEKLIKNTAKQDGRKVTVKGFQDPGGAGKGEAENFVKMLSGFSVKIEKISVNKETAAGPLSAQAENGNVMILKSCKNKKAFYEEAEDFPKGNHDDMVDAASGAFNQLNSSRVGRFTKDMEADSMEDEYIQEDRW